MFSTKLKMTCLWSKLKWKSLVSLFSISSQLRTRLMWWRDHPFRLQDQKSPQTRVTNTSSPAPLSPNQAEGLRFVLAQLRLVGLSAGVQPRPPQEAQSEWEQPAAGWRSEASEWFPAESTVSAAMSEVSSLSPFHRLFFFGDYSIKDHWQCFPEKKQHLPLWTVLMFSDG